MIFGESPSCQVTPGKFHVRGMDAPVNSWSDMEMAPEGRTLEPYCRRSFCQTPLAESSVVPSSSEDKPSIRQYSQSSQKSEISVFWFDIMGSIVILKATIGKLDTAYAFSHMIDALLFGVFRTRSCKRAEIEVT
jgi:hypothetical protein